MTTDAEDFTIETRDDLEFAIEELGTVQSELEKETRKRDRRIRKQKQRNADAIDTLSEHEAALKEQITAFAREHKDELLKEADGKTAKLMTGDLSFRKGKPSVSWSSKKKAIEALRDAGHGHLVTIKETLHVTKLRKYPEIVQNIKQLTWQDAEDSVSIKPL